MAASHAPNHTEAEKAIGELVLKLQVLDPCATVTLPYININTPTYIY